MVQSSDDGPGRPVSRDQPFYAEGAGPGQLLLGHCATCGQAVPFVTDDKRWFVMLAVKAGWKYAALTTGEEFTCPACSAVARANLDAALREEVIPEETDEN
jgi:hypothetical protein